MPDTDPSPGPPESPAGAASLSRRSMLLGIGGAAAASLAACSSSKKKTGGSPSSGGLRRVKRRRRAGGGSITFGSNYSDAGAEGRVRGADRRGDGEDRASQITINTVDHNTFQNNISNYLQGTPDDLATWFAGYRLQFFAAQGLLEPDRRRLGQDRRQLQRRREEPVQGPRRPLLPGAALQLPVGRLLQQERLRSRRATRSRRPGTTSWRWPSRCRRTA